MLSQQWRFLTTINNDVTTSGTMDIVVFRVGKVRFSGTRKFVFLKASSEERCAPQNFCSPCDIKRYTCSPHLLRRCTPNEKGYGK